MNRTAGLVTAAGASSRMGTPKALLQDAAGSSLAQRQMQFLESGGCHPVVLVLGADADTIRAQLPATLSTVTNPHWAQGRLTSVQAGLRHLLQTDPPNGIVIVPIDAMGIQADTLAHLLDAARTTGHPVIRPTYEGQRGHIVWIATAIAQQIVDYAGHPDTPVHDILAPFTVEQPVADPAILANVNTPADWQRLRHQK